MLAVAILAASAGGTSAAGTSRRPAPGADNPVEIAAADPADNKHSIAVIIGNKDYAALPVVPFGRRDANAVRRFVSEGLGYRDGNIIDLRDATKAEMEKVLGSEASPRGKLFDWTRRGSSDVLIYFSGHGLTGPDDKRAYLLPVDVNPELVEATGYAVDLLLENLASLNAGSVTMLLDVGFSARSHGGRLTPAATVASAATVAPAAMMIPAAVESLVIVTATQGGQTAGWEEDARHGLFTFHLLNALRGFADGPHYGNGDRAVTLGEVSHFLDDQMTFEAHRRHGRLQRANVVGDPSTALALYDRRRLPAPTMTMTELAARHREVQDLLSRAAQSVALKIEAEQAPTDAAVGPTSIDTEADTADSQSEANDASIDVAAPAPEAPVEQEVAPTGLPDAIEDAAPVAATIPEPSSPAEPDTAKPVAATEPDVSAARTAPTAPTAQTALVEPAEPAEPAESVERAEPVAPTVSVETEPTVDQPERTETAAAAVFTEPAAAEPTLDTANPNPDPTTDRAPDAVDTADAAAELEIPVADAVEPNPAPPDAVAAGGGDAGELNALTTAFTPAGTPDSQVAVGVFSKEPGTTIKDCDACPELVVVPGGAFIMGAPALEPERWPSEGPQHRVNLRGFALGKFEVTFAQYAECVRDKSCRPSNGSQSAGNADRPVVKVSWADAQAYAGWLSTKTGKVYRLPSEAEWEYAARAGTTTPFFFGHTITSEQANYNGNYAYNGGPTGRYLGHNAPVGAYPANAFGLHDLHGNVWEWVEDCWHDDYNGAPDDGSPWVHPESCKLRVLRGGSGAGKPSDLRAARRVGSVPGDRSLNDVGFRVARSLD